MSSMHMGHHRMPVLSHRMPVLSSGGHSGSRHAPSRTNATASRTVTDRLLRCAVLPRCGISSAVGTEDPSAQPRETLPDSPADQSISQPIDCVSEVHAARSAPAGLFGFGQRQDTCPDTGAHGESHRVFPRTHARCAHPDAMYRGRSRTIWLSDSRDGFYDTAYDHVCVMGSK